MKQVALHYTRHENPQLYRALLMILLMYLTISWANYLEKLTFKSILTYVLLSPLCGESLSPLKAKVKAELDNLTDQNVITLIQDPTDWVSNLVVTMKKYGDLRVCLDPQCLTKALKRKLFRFMFTLGRYST